MMQSVELTSRSNKLPRVLLSTAAVVAAAWLFSTDIEAVEQAVQRPNVLLIYTDDQGSLDVNCYGSLDLVTPNLDRLASEGIRFTQMYAPSAICSSSRAGLLTGRFPARAGVPSNVSSEHGKAGMPAKEITIAEVLQANGYRTGHVGKWHLGYTPDTMPNQQGFDRSFGHMGGCIDNYSHFFYWNGPNRHDLWRDGKEVFRDGEFFLDLMVQEGIDFIEADSEQPFFLYWAINAPHYPMQGTAKWRKHYADLPSPRRQYAEFVSTVDEKIGLLVDTLDRLGLREKTLVLVQSDHGHSTEERAFWGGGNAGQFRGAKGCLFEGGLRVPSIISMPKTLPQGETRSQLATGCDWFPTIVELCQLAPQEHRIDGKSLVKLLRDNQAKSPHEHFFWLLGRGANAQWAVRKGDWKLLGNPRDTTSRKNPGKMPPRILVNLREDIGERENLVAQQPKIVAQLEAIQSRYVEEIQSP